MFLGFFAFPLLGLRVSPFTLWVPTLHTEGLQQPEVSSVQPASLRLRWVYVSAISVCFWTPRLSLGHPGSFRSTHDLKCMRKQTGPRFHFPSERRGTNKPTTWVPSTNIQPKPWFKSGAKQASTALLPLGILCVWVYTRYKIQDSLFVLFGEITVLHACQSHRYNKIQGDLSIMKSHTYPYIYEWCYQKHLRAFVHV